jgi:amidohydrolase
MDTRTDSEVLKAKVCAEIDRRASMLIGASHEIYAHPELNYEEHFAHDLLTSILASEGIDHERSAYGLATAFEGRAGSGGASVGVLCEYDALPEIGHACGHNIIATAGLGAGLALAAVAGEAGGRVRILGTPAEEGGGGKIVMAERGALDGIDVAMMVHPAGADLLAMTTIANQELAIEYTGQAAHAAAAPWKGRNALDAAVLGYINVAALRQHILPNERVHGIFTKAGDKPNIVPRAAASAWYVRSPTVKQLQPLKERVLRCLEAGAAAAGCEMEHHWATHTYSEMIDCAPLVRAYVANSERLGRTVLDPSASPVVGSTDMGNVSYLVPSIHPMIAVSPRHVSIHTPEFASYARGENGDKAVLDGAKAMAMTAIDVWTNAELRADAASEWASEVSARG